MKEEKKREGRLQILWIPHLLSPHSLRILDSHLQTLLDLPRLATSPYNIEVEHSDISATFDARSRLIQFCYIVQNDERFYA